MRHAMKPTLALMLLVFTSGCVGITAVGPGPFEIKEAYQVQLGKTWTAYPRGESIRVQSLTIDGLTLNALRFGADLEDGQALIKTTDREQLIPVFRADMLPVEIAEFVQDTLTYAGLRDVELVNLRPEKFGTLDGLRADMTGAQVNGLKLSGTVKAAIEEEKLHLIFYYAPSEYYHGLHKDEVDQILASVKLL